MKIYILTLTVNSMHYGVHTRLTKYFSTMEKAENYLNKYIKENSLGITYKGDIAVKGPFNNIEDLTPNIKEVTVDE